MSDDSDDEEVSDMDAFEKMRCGAEDQVGVRLPWGQCGTKKKGMDRSLCRNELETKRRPPPSGQTCLLAHAIRPERWSTEPFKLDEDVLQLITEALMCYTGGDRDIRALAVTSRACAKGVRTALDMARRKLNVLKVSYNYRKELARMQLEEGDPAAVDLQVELAYTDAKDAFAKCMYHMGIPPGRAT